MNVSKLIQKIEESGLKKVYIAEKLGLSNQGLYNKLKGLNDLTRNEISILCEILQISDLNEKESIFFN